MNFCLLVPLGKAMAAIANHPVSTDDDDSHLRCILMGRLRVIEYHLLSLHGHSTLPVGHDSEYDFQGTDHAKHVRTF